MLQETHEKLNIDYCICQFRGYKVYTTRSSSKNAYGGTAILIKNNIRHSWLGGFSGPEHQTTVINISTVRGCIKLTSCYIHYKAKVNEDFFKRLLPVETDKYIIAGDFNAKHSDWGCNINTPRGNLMSKVIKSNGLEIISPREPTRNLSSDVLDFAISNHKFDISSVRVIDDLSSDHLPVIIHLNTDIIQRLSYEPGNNSRDPCDVCQVKELVEMENHLKQKMSPARVENLKKKFMGKQKRRPKRRKLQRSNSWREEQEPGNQRF